MTTPDDAMSFLIRYAQRHRREAFSPEDVISAAAVVGIQFDETRQWGAVFRQCAKDGYIRRAGMFARVTSHRSVRPGWIGT